MSKLPIKREQNALTPQSPENRLAQMRAEAGITERRTLQFTCGETGQPFSIAFTRRSASHRWQIAQTNAQPARGGLLGALFGGGGDTAEAMDIDAFDFGGFACPQCGHSATLPARFFGCGCGKLICGARVTRMNGVTRFACFDACGKTGVLNATLETVSASDGHSAPALGGPQGAKRLAAPRPKFLPRK